MKAYAERVFGKVDDKDVISFIFLKWSKCQLECGAMVFYAILALVEADRLYANII